MILCLLWPALCIYLFVWCVYRVIPVYSWVWKTDGVGSYGNYCIYSFLIKLSNWDSTY